MRAINGTCTFGQPHQTFKSSITIAIASPQGQIIRSLCVEMNVATNSWRIKDTVNFPIVNNSLHVIKWAHWTNFKITQHAKISPRIDWQYLVFCIWKKGLRWFAMVNNITLFMWSFLANYLPQILSIKIWKTK